MDIIQKTSFRAVTFFLLLFSICQPINAVAQQAPNKYLAAQYADNLHIDSSLKSQLTPADPAELKDSDDPYTMSVDDLNDDRKLRVKLLDTNPGKIKEINKALREVTTNKSKAYSEYRQKIIPILKEKAYDYFAESLTADELRTLITYTSLPAVQKGLIRGVEQQKTLGATVWTPEEEKEIKSFMQTESGKLLNKELEPLAIKQGIVLMLYPMNVLAYAMSPEGSFNFTLENEQSKAYKKYNLNAPDPTKTEFLSYKKGTVKITLIKNKD